MNTALYIKNRFQVASNLIRMTGCMADFCADNCYYFDDASFFYLDESLSCADPDSFYILFTEQDEAGAHQSGFLFLCFGYSGSGASEADVNSFARKAVEFLGLQGFRVEWDGSVENRIRVDMTSFDLQDSDYMDIAITISGSLRERYRIVLDDYGENSSDDDSDNVYFYHPMAEGESVVDAVRRMKLVSPEDILQYQRCFNSEECITACEPFTDWNMQAYKAYIELLEEDPLVTWKSEVTELIELLKGRVDPNQDLINERIASYWDRIKDEKHLGGDSVYRQVALLLSQYYRGQIHFQPLRNLMLKGFDHQRLSLILEDIRSNHASML